MCEFLSKINGVRITDADVIAYHEGKPEPIRWIDFTGHSGIGKVFPKTNGLQTEGWDNITEDEKKLILSGDSDHIIDNIDNWKDAPEWTIPIWERLNRFGVVLSILARVDYSRFCEYAKKHGTFNDSAALYYLTSLPEGVTISAGGDLYLNSLTSLPEGVIVKCKGKIYFKES